MQGRWPGNRGSIIQVLSCILAVGGACSASVSGIAVDKSGNVYFSDWLRNRIWKIVAQGSADPLAARHTHHLVLDREGNLYGEHVSPDGGIASLWKMTTGGVFADVIASAPRSQKPLFAGGAFAIAHDGSVVTARQCVLYCILTDRAAKWTGSDCGERAWTDDALRFAHLHGSMAWDQNGVLYFTDARTVRRIFPDGSAATLGGRAVPLFSEPQADEAKFDRALGLGVGSDGAVYVADSDRGVVRIGPHSTSQLISSSGWFWSPTGLTVSGGNVYVVENRPGYLTPFGAVLGNPRVRKISPNGMAITLFTVRNERLAALLAMVVVALLAVAVVFLRRTRAARLLLAFPITVNMASAHPGWGIVVDHQGGIYFTDLSQVWRLGPQGTRKVFVPRVHSHALMLDLQGNLYGEHLWYEASEQKFYSRTWKATLAGHIQDSPKQSAEARTVDLSRALVRDGDGSTYIIEGDSVLKITPGGNKIAIAQGLVAPIPPWDPAGQGRFNRLLGLSMDGTGRVYVANYGNRKVQRVTPNGRIETVYRSDWFFWGPSGVAVTPQCLYVLESGIPPIVGVRVRKFLSGGDAVTLVTVIDRVTYAVTAIAVLIMGGLCLLIYRLGPRVFPWDKGPRRASR